MPQLLAPLCVALLAVAGTGQQISTHSLTATVTFAPRTALTISTSTLHFVVTDSAIPAYATVEYSAAARTRIDGEVTLVLRVSGDVAPGVVLSIAGGSDDVVVGEVASRQDAAAARWTGSGLRTGRITIALSARPGTYDVPVAFVLKLS